MSHRRLVHKLQAYGLSGKVLNWFRDYLTCRKQRGVLENGASEWMDVTSGVSQGSIIGPLMFLLFFNNMPIVANSGVTTLFADDARCFKENKSLDDHESLQNDVINRY